MPADPPTDLGDAVLGGGPTARRGRELRGMGPRVGPPIAESPSPPELRRRESFHRRALVTADAVAVVAALLLAVEVIGDEPLPASALLGVPLLILFSKAAGLYDRDDLLIRKAATLDELPDLLNVATLLALVTAIAGPSGADLEVGTDVLLSLWAGLLALLLLLRSAARAVAVRRTSVERCLVLGDADAYSALQRKLEESPFINSCVVGYVPLRDVIREDDPTPIGKLQELEGVVRSGDVHRIIVAPRESGPDASVEVVRRAKAAGARVSVVPRILEVVGSSVAFDDIDGMTVLGVRRFGLTRSSAVIKRSLDLVASVLGLLAATPLLALVAAAIKLDSRGPVLFRQNRVGRDGKIFRIIKFRTMVVDAEARKPELSGLSEREGLFKITDDPRVTRVGRWLRSTSVDELPQLLNVVRGEMSLVGPRPLVLDEDDQVESWQRRRLQIKPGMTGPWQILGSARIPLYEMVKIDYLYVANWLLWVDVKLLLRTVVHVVARRNR